MAVISEAFVDIFPALVAMFPVFVAIFAVFVAIFTVLVAIFVIFVTMYASKVETLVFRMAKSTPSIRPSLRSTSSIVTPILICASSIVVMVRLEASVMA